MSGIALGNQEPRTKNQERAVISIWETWLSVGRGPLQSDPVRPCGSFWPESLGAFVGENEWPPGIVEEARLRGLVFLMPLEKFGVER
jgi:hypothetical protein